jgi:hypothetical protein
LTIKIRRDCPWGLLGGIYLNFLIFQTIFLIKKREGKKQKSLEGVATHNSLRLCTTGGDDRLTQGQNINIFLNYLNNDLLLKLDNPRSYSLSMKSFHFY